MEKQKELAELLWSIDNTRQAYKKLLVKTDELVKSQFIAQIKEWKCQLSWIMIGGVSYA